MQRQAGCGRGSLSGGMGGVLGRCVLDVEHLAVCV